MIELNSMGREACAVGPDGDEIVVGHIYRVGDRLVPVLLPQFVGYPVAEKVMAGCLAQASLSDFSPVPNSKGAA